MRTCQAAMTRWQDKEEEHVAEKFAEKTKESNKCEQKMQKTAQDFVARLRQVESMQLQLHAMFNTAKCDKTIESLEAEEHVATASTMCLSPKETSEVPAIPEEETIRCTSQA